MTAGAATTACDDEVFDGELAGWSRWNDDLIWPEPVIDLA
jgi:hypothetical protein